MKIYPIEAGNFKLDGGAMFGVVPKVLWERTNPADKNNKIEMASRCLLIEEGNRLILIDTGMGNKQSDKFFSHYDLWGNYTLETSLLSHGFHKNDITDVFLTHLHFDHCGGAIYKDPQERLRPSFKNAVYWVHRKHWEWAKAPNAREKASFLKENMFPIEESGQLNFIEGDGPLILSSFFPFSILLVNGHTEKQMIPIIKYQGKQIAYVADLIPTVGHLPIPYIMSYDTRPLITLNEKKAFLIDAVQKETLLFFEHDPIHELISIHQTEKGVRMKENYSFDSYFSK